MKVLTGIDIIEIDRIKKSIDSLNGKFEKEIFTQSEIDYCESKKKQNISTTLQDSQQKKQYLRLFLNF